MGYNETPMKGSIMNIKYALGYAIGFVKGFVRGFKNGLTRNV